MRFLSDLPNGIPVLVLVLLDIDTQKQNEQKLPTRRSRRADRPFEPQRHPKRISEFLEGRGPAASHALFMIDVDNFKASTTPLAIRPATACLPHRRQNTAAASATPNHRARRGTNFCADEVPVGRLRARTKAASLLETLQYVCSTADASLELFGSVGISLYPENGRARQPLQGGRDQALYRAKERANQLSIAGEEAPAVLSPPSCVKRPVRPSATLLENMEGAIFVFRGDGQRRSHGLFAATSTSCPRAGRVRPRSGVCPLLSSVPRRDLAALTER